MRYSDQIRLVASPLTMALIVLTGTLGCKTLTPIGQPPPIITFERKDLSRFCSQLPLAPNYIDSVTRDGSGTKLHVKVAWKDPNASGVIVLDGDAVRTVESSYRYSALDDQEQVVAWPDSTRKNVQLANGFQVPLQEVGSVFRLDPSGKFFVLGQPPSVCRVGSVTAKTPPTCVSTNFWPSALFVQGNRIVVSGMYYNGNRRSASRPAGGCLFLTTNGFEIAKELTLPGFIVDIDPGSTWMLLQTGADLHASMFLYDPERDKRRKLGRLTTYAFFFKGELPSGLQAKWLR